MNDESVPKLKMSMGPPKPGECAYPAKYGNYCHRPGIPEQGGLCFWHSNLPKTREQVITEIQIGGSLEGVVLKNLDLRGTKLTNAWMRGFTAYHCSFDETNLESSWMQMAVFEGCNFIKANLRNVYAVSARLTNCIFYEADLFQANLLGADLTDSSFQNANLQEAHLGQPPLMIYPGIGNPDQYYTRIEGTSFKGADFRNINLDKIYQDAPNLQEPLKQLWLYEIREQLDGAMNSPQSNADKKKSLEDLAASILDNIPGLQVQFQDKRRKTSEIDLIVQNRSGSLAAAGLAGPIFVECKNIKKGVSAKDIRDFIGKLPSNSIGIVVTTNRLSRDAEGEMRRHNNENGIRLLFWNHLDIEKMASGEETPENLFIERYYYVLGL